LLLGQSFQHLRDAVLGLDDRISAHSGISALVASGSTGEVLIACVCVWSPQVALLMAGLYGIFFFKEITSWFAIIFFFISAGVLLGGAALLSVYG
jgi:uncharacterized membrane protein